MLRVLMPLEILSGGMTPRERMPDLVRWIVLAAPTAHLVTLALAIPYRGARADGWARRPESPATQDCAGS
jgi:ABC-2 type transport system permease protein